MASGRCFGARALNVARACWRCCATPSRAGIPKPERVADLARVFDHGATCAAAPNEDATILARGPAASYSNDLEIEAPSKICAPASVKVECTYADASAGRNLSSNRDAYSIKVTEAPAAIDE